MLDIKPGMRIRNNETKAGHVEVEISFVQEGKAYYTRNGRTNGVRLDRIFPAGSNTKRGWSLV